jgi:GNAT superfamily N-acetyltransferase
MATQQVSPALSVTVGRLQPQHLDEADRICRIAFGTFLGVPDPLQFFGDANYLHTRSRAAHCEAYGAWIQDRLVGSNIATRWGSVGFFGPLTVYPEFWDRKIGARLMEPIMQAFERWRIQHAGLFTFPQSPKHLALYGKFGFWPRYLTPVMSKPVTPHAMPPQERLYSQLNWTERQAALAGCRELADAIYPGLDVTPEIQAVEEQKLGETVLIEGPRGVEAFAVCHCGPQTEAGSGTCYVKFGASRPGPQARASFALLMDAVEAMASARDLKRISAGVNTSRLEAYADMLANGFRAGMHGVTMHRATDEGYHRAGLFVLDDWR